MKSPQIIYRLIINGLILSTIFASILFPSPTSASTQDAVSSINQDSIIPGLSRTSVNAPNVPNAPAAIDAVPDISITDAISVTEGDSGTMDAVFWVSLSDYYTETVTVDYVTENDTAVAPDDYTGISGSLTFEAEQDITLPITVTILGDYIDESDETFTVTLSNPISGTLVNATGLGTIIDDDTADMTIFPTSGLTTTETGGTDSFTVALTSQPTATVTIDLTSSDPGEGTVLPATLTFTDTDWSTPQTVTITGVDDLIDDGDVPYSIQVSASSADGNYNDLLPVDVSVTNIDDDIGPEVVVAPLALTTSETGTTDEFSIVLTTQPTNIVHILIVVTDTTEGSVSLAEFPFNSQNWNIPQTITVTGEDDFVLDGDVTYAIQIQVSSTDPDYNNFPTDDVVVTNQDDDTAGIVVVPLDQETSELGDTGAFTVALTSQPTATVTIDLTSSDTSEGTVFPTTLNFTNATWSLPQTVTVTGVDDQVVDGDVAYVIQFAVSSADGVYDGMVVADVDFTNLDNDAAGITIFPTSGLTTTEAGGTDTFTVSLTTAPTATVTIDLSSSNVNEGTVSPTSLSFTTANWDSPQPVTVAGEDDPVDDGDQAYTIVTGAAVSADPNYGGLEVADVSVTNLDDDTAGIMVVPLDQQTSELGDTGSFTVALTSQPTATVTIDLSSSDPGEGTVLPVTLTFMETTWSIPQTVTVTGEDDWVDDGDIGYGIQLAVSSADGIYDVMNPADVGFTNLDNDTAGMTISPTSGLTTTEIGDTASFTVVLDSQPTALVTVTLTSSDPGEGSVAPATLSFTDTNWSLPQTVTVTGENDFVDDGDVPYSIQVSSSSADGNYNSLSPVGVGVTNFDDDIAGITVIYVPDLWTDESGGQATFSVVLDSQPTAAVTITLSSSNTAEGVISTDTLVFDGANWNSPQPITITGVDDDVADGDIPYTITIDPAISNDSNYHGLNPSNVSVTNADDDAVGIDIYPTLGLTTTESGDTDTFFVVLESEPVLDVTLHLTSTDTTEGMIAPDILVFSAANWYSPQPVTITGVDDDAVDGPIPYTILTGAAISGDENFNGINPPNVSVTNFDNDVPGITVTTDPDLTTTESGDTATFSVVLDTQPRRSVNIRVGSSNEDEGTVVEEFLTFMTTTWNIPQEVVITGQDDFWDDGDQPYDIQMSVYSGDSDYDGMVLSDVPVTNLDDDVAGFDVTPTSGLITTEAGGEDTFTIRLTSQPTATVTIALSSNDSSEGTVSPGSLIFNQFNWTQPQTATVAGVDDDLVDGDIGYAIVTAPALSNDPVYHGLNPPNVSVTNQDDDEPIDSEVPTVSWLSPVGDGEQKILTNAPEDQVVRLEADASDNVAIDHVKFRRWDAYQMAWVDIANVYNQPYQVDLDTNVLRCGFNQVNAEAYDTSGNNTVEDKSGAYIWLLRYCYVYMPSVNK